MKRLYHPTIKPMDKYHNLPTNLCLSDDVATDLTKHHSALPKQRPLLYEDSDKCFTHSMGEDVEGEFLIQSDSSEDNRAGIVVHPVGTLPLRKRHSSGPYPNGKKTKGRVKVDIEFIENKLKRYTTFSKRKSGLMKKAYELSTLTGTQVMLLVASETGHVYTFATRKLQPMITSDAGKSLIQTCLNTPDSEDEQDVCLPSTSSLTKEQRMSESGFEETDLNYST